MDLKDSIPSHVTRGASWNAGLNQPNHLGLPEWINTLSYG